MKTCAEIIRGLREDRDLSQSDIAQILNTSQQHYSKYETGTIDIPLRALVILADYYKVSSDYILGRRSVLYGVPGLNKKVADGHTVGSVISDILSLGAHGRAFVLEAISAQKVYAEYKRLMGKDGVTH